MTVTDRTVEDTMETAEDTEEDVVEVTTEITAIVEMIIVLEVSSMKIDENIMSIHSLYQFYNNERER